VLKLKVDTLKETFPQIYSSLGDVAGLISQTISDVNSLIYDSMPYSLENLGLEGAIRALVEQYEYNTRLHLQFQLWFNLTDIPFEKTLQIYIYRILQECLNNIAKHAKATHVTVQLTKLPDGLLLMVEDDGIGFDLEEKLKQNPGSSGLKNLIERCKLIHAEIDIDTVPGHGCTINIVFPL
jgi:two-component system sensor histidine kinase DegS